MPFNIKFSNKNLFLIKVNTIITFFLFNAFVISIIANIYFLKKRYIWLYFLKHASLIIIACLGLLLLPKVFKKSHLGIFFSYFIFLLPLVLFGTNNILVLISYYIFFIICIVISRIWNKEQYLILGIIFLLSCFISPIIDILFNHGNFIYNNFYGRYRLLLGFNHPKEAGIAFLISFLLIRFSLMQNVNIKKKKYIFDFFVLFFLYLISSRNAFLFYFNFLLFNFLFEKFKFYKTILIFFSIYIITPIYLTIIFYSKIDKIISNRLTVWAGGNVSFFGSGSKFASLKASGMLSKFHIDNFYLEYLIENGIFVFILLLVFLFGIIFYLKLLKIDNIYINSLFIPFLIFCFFDAGMFSTGNFLNVFVWSFVIAGLFYKRKIWLISKTNSS